MNQLSKTKGKRHWWDYVCFYLNRYIRLTPVQAYAILFSMSLWKYFGTGPFYSGMADALNDRCKDTWWTNLLYITSLSPPWRSCIGWCWYLSNDMMYYICMPFLSLLLYHYPKVGLTTATWVLFGSIVTDATLAGINSIQPDVFYWCIGMWP